MYVIIEDTLTEKEIKSYKIEQGLLSMKL